VPRPPRLERDRLVSSSSRPPVDERALAELVAPVPLARAFPELAAREPVEFAVREREDAVRVRLPDTASIPPAVLQALDALATACREAYGLGVEVIADDRDDARAALDVLRRCLDLP